MLRTYRAIAVASLALMTLGAGCSDPAAERPRAVVIGVDGADWKLIDQLVAEGGLPNFAALI